MLQELFNAIFNGLFGGIVAWFKEQQARSDAIGRAESEQRVKADLEGRLEKEKVDKAMKEELDANKKPDMGDWN